MGRKYLGNVFYDVAKNGICRAAEVLASELEQHGIAVLALTPGWVLAERMTDLTEQQRAQTESPEYIGRAIAALASDPGIVRRTGQTLAVGNLARESDLLTSTAVSQPPIRSSGKASGRGA